MPCGDDSVRGAALAGQSARRWGRAPGAPQPSALRPWECTWPHKRGARSLPLPATPPPPADAAAPAAPLRFLAAGLAAAALATATPAQAGVVLVQPEVKNFVKDTPAASSGAAKAAPAKKAAAPKREESGSSGAGFEAFRPAVLPLAVVAIAGAGAAAVKADPEFAKLVDESWGAKNSNAIGAGYETAPGLKVGAGRLGEVQQQTQAGHGGCGGS